MTLWKSRPAWRNGNDSGNSRSFWSTTQDGGMRELKDTHFAFWDGVCATYDIQRCGCSLELPWGGNEIAHFHGAWGHDLYTITLRRTALYLII